MSLSSTSTLKQQLTVNLGEQAPVYFDSLKAFVSGKISRVEFEETAKQLLSTGSLVQIHNALIISLFDATASLKRPPTPPPPVAPKPPPRKRRRTLLPYQGPNVSDEARTLRSARLKRWTLAMGKRERERVLGLQAAQPHVDPSRLRVDTNEVARERGVEFMLERGDPPGSRLPIHLHAVTRAPTVQHIADRINLICAQNGLSAPSRTVPSLMNLACEAKLKQLITHAITLTSTSNVISSINPSTSQSSNTALHHPAAHKPPILTLTSFQTLFTVSATDLPNKSAAALRLAMAASPPEDDETEDLLVLKDREVRDQRWQIMALLGERSTVREGLRGVR